MNYIFNLFILVLFLFCSASNVGLFENTLADVKWKRFTSLYSLLVLSLPFAWFCFMCWRDFHYSGITYPFSLTMHCWIAGFLAGLWNAKSLLKNYPNE